MDAIVIQSLDAQVAALTKAQEESESTAQEEENEVQEALAYMTGQMYDLQVW